MRSLMPRLMPFIILGIMVVFLIIGLVVLSYVLVIGAIVGLILFAIAWIKERFFATKLPQKRSPRGRTYDHDEFR